MRDTDAAYLSKSHARFLLALRVSPPCGATLQPARLLRPCTSPLAARAGAAPLSRSSNNTLVAEVGPASQFSNHSGVQSSLTALC